jgi:hypothetical protein
LLNDGYIKKVSNLLDWAVIITTVTIVVSFSFFFVKSRTQQLAGVSRFQVQGPRQLRHIEL